MKRDVVAAALALSVALLIARSPHAQAQSPRPSYVGVWMPSGVSCGPSPETTDEFRKLTARGMEGPESLCKFERITGGSGRWSVSMTCHVEGTTSRERMEILVDGSTMTLSQRSPGSKPASYRRCS